MGDDWLSILGLNTGLTGLAKDFVLNYMGRSAYHDNNGPLIGAIKTVSESFDDGDIEQIRAKAVAVCREGNKLFQGGSLHTMLSDLESIVNKESNGKYFEKALNENSDVKAAFDYLAGPSPGSQEL